MLFNCDMIEQAMVYFVCITNHNNKQSSMDDFCSENVHQFLKVKLNVRELLIYTLNKH